METTKQSIFAFFLIFGKKALCLFTTKFDISRFFIFFLFWFCFCFCVCVFLLWNILSLICSEILLWNCVEFLSQALCICWDYQEDFAFISLIHYITIIDFQIFHKLWIPVITSVWSWCIITLCCCNQCANILLKTYISLHFCYWSIVFFLDFFINFCCTIILI